MYQLKQRDLRKILQQKISKNESVTSCVLSLHQFDDSDPEKRWKNPEALQDGHDEIKVIEIN
jgi:hypothetical protein